jgi:hypothetical protein
MRRQHQASRQISPESPMRLNISSLTSALKQSPLPQIFDSYTGDRACFKYSARTAVSIEKSACLQLFPILYSENKAVSVI